MRTFIINVLFLIGIILISFAAKGEVGEKGANVKGSVQGSVGIPYRPQQAEKNEPKPIENILKYVKGWRISSENKFYNYSKVYIVDQRSWLKPRTTKYRVIGPTLKSDDIFNILEGLTENERLRNVEKKSDDIYSLILLDGLEIRENGRSSIIDLKSDCQFLISQGETTPTMPRRFIFTGKCQKEGGTFAGVMLVFTWDYFKFDDQNFYWLPVDIRIEIIAMRRGRQVKLTENWKLVALREGYEDSSVGEIDVVTETNMRKVNAKSD